ncbi:MAG: 30S ribosomal protein S6 [Bacteroidetes bacterium]|nr:30S ribosomal protein S6 [Bacteroidota bacterium]
MKRYYECTFIVNPGLDDGQIESTVKMAEDTIVKNGGELVATEHIGRRRLAYPIAKKHNGYYVTVEFQAEGRIVEKVERFLKLDENVMRFLTLTLDDRELEAKRNRIAFAAQDRGRNQEEAKDDKPEAKDDTPKAKDDTPEAKDDAPEAEDTDAGKQEKSTATSEATEASNENSEEQKENGGE